MYELKLDQYQGPLDKLLELIESKKMEIGTIALASVTADFLHYLEGFKIDLGIDEDSLSEHAQYDAPLELLADFLVVASRLLLIKSKTLLPSLELTEDEQAEIQDLETRLKLYQEFKRTQEHIRAHWSDMPKMYTREFMLSAQVVFYPPSNSGPNELLGAILKISGALESAMTPKVRVKNQILNLRTKIEEVIAKLTNIPQNLRALHGKGNRTELVVLFLAILHLIKQQIVKVEQVDHFSEIMIAKIDALKVE
jgi:segregation and condensation protein A